MEEISKRCDCEFKPEIRPNCSCASEKPEIQQFPIDPDGRYLLMVKGLSPAAFESVAEGISKWWMSGDPVALVSIAPGVEIEFVRMDDEQEENYGEIAKIPKD